MKALQAATANAARLLRVPEVGTIEPGKAADLVLWQSSPIEDVTALLSPSLVMRAGEVVSGGA